MMVESANKLLLHVQIIALDSKIELGEQRCLLLTAAPL